MLTIEQALQRKVTAKVLRTLMLPADRDLLKGLAQTRHSRGSRHQFQLTRLSVALRAEGQAGLVGWLQMRNQPGGIGRANKLIERSKNSPVMDLSDGNKSDLDTAIKRLVAQGLGDGGAATADPQAAAPVPSTVDVTMEEAAGPSATVTSPAFDLGDVAGPSWIHHQQPATPALMVALDNLGWRPSAQTPQTTLQIHGRTYTAHVHDGTVWLTPSRPAHEIEGSSQLAPLPTGRVSLAALDADLGIASGRGLNCLLDTVLQLARGMRRQDLGTPQALAQDAQELRRALAAVGLVERDGMIDVYGPGGVGVFLAQNLRVRIQVVQAHESEGLLAHPVLGEEGPLVHILHTNAQTAFPGGLRPSGPGTKVAALRPVNASCPRLAPGLPWTGRPGQPVRHFIETPPCW